MEIRTTNVWNNFKSRLSRIKNFFKLKSNNKQINYNEYLSKFERLTFLVLIGYVVLATVSVFLFNFFDSKENEIHPPFLIVSLLSLITCGVFFLFKRKDKILEIIYWLLVILMDVFSFVLAYYSTNISNSSNNLHCKHVYIFIISTFIFAILKFNFSFLHILAYLVYKSIIFGILINTFNLDANNQKVNFAFEIICFSLICFSIFLFKLINQDFLTKSIEHLVKNKFAIEYFQSLINTIDKGFLSLNLTNYTINVNKSFINFMKTIGISEEIIYENLYNSQDKKPEKPNILHIRSFRRSKISTKNDFRNMSTSDRFYLRNSVSVRGKNSTIIKNLNFNKKDQNDYIAKDNSELKNFNCTNIKNENLFNINEENLRKSSKNKHNAYKLDFNIIPVCNNNEESFLLKIDFLLNHVFSHFYEENANIAILKNTMISNSEKSSLAEAIREIFFSKKENNNENDKNQSFIFKGIYEFKENKLSTKENQKTNIILEVHYRKINTISGNLVEFFLNDLTTKQQKIETTEKAETKIKSNVLAKISNEFKTPLITIIYILKNYIKKTHVSKNGLSLEEVQTFDEDYISNTIDLSDYMLSLVNDISDFSALNSNCEIKCEFDNFDLHELLFFGLRILKILINCRGLKDYVHPLLEINENVPKTFCSDEKRVKQILLNLITNSIKFTRRGYIKISAIISNGKNLIVSIEDTGIGIQSKDLCRIFIKENEYGKGCEKTKITEEPVGKLGSGLGLSVCKRIVEKIGKCIEVESIPNKKTEFYFVLETKQNMKKSYSVTRTIEENFEQFKKSIMNVTTKSVKQAKINNQNPSRKSKSFNTHVQINRINNSSNNNNINNFSVKKSFFHNNNNHSSEIDAQLNTNNLQNKSMEKKASKISKNNDITNLVDKISLENLGPATEENYNSHNLNVNAVEMPLEISKSEISSSEETIKYSETKQKMEFQYNNAISERSNSSECSIKLKNPFILLQEKPKSHMKSNSKLKSEIDKSFYKFTKPIKKFYDMKNKDIILVVDDNKFLRKSLKNNIRTIFTDTSVDVIGCSDGIESLYLVMLDQMTKNRIRLIISDENMLYMNGTELNMILSSFHFEGKMSFIPFALCSAALNDEEFMIRNRINYVINKPPTKNELKSVFMALNLI